jgi:hypothetical protein
MSKRWERQREDCVHNRRGRRSFSFNLCQVRSLDTLIPPIVVPVMIINVVIAVVIITVSGPGDDDGNRFRVRGSQSEQS